MSEQDDTMRGASEARAAQNRAGDGATPSPATSHASEGEEVKAPGTAPETSDPVFDGSVRTLGQAQAFVNYQLVQVLKDQRDEFQQALRKANTPRDRQLFTLLLQATNQSISGLNAAIKVLMEAESRIRLVGAQDMPRGGVA